MSVALQLNIKRKPIKPVSTRHALSDENVFASLMDETDPYKTLLTGGVMAKAWAKKLKDEERLSHTQNFIQETIHSYWKATHNLSLKQKPLPAQSVLVEDVKLDNSVLAVAEAIGIAASKLDIITASYQIGNLYTSVLPESLRSGNGVFYTPPMLTRRLLDMSASAGIDWSTASVADPACGGGAFLAPVALKMVDAFKDKDPLSTLKHIETHLKGYELDPFAAWLTQVFLEVTLKDIIVKAGKKIKNLVSVCNTLEYSFGLNEQFDLVIGNPPYGKVKLTGDIKDKFQQSLYGHPNLYGLFTHLAINMVKPGGIIGFLTPTSFLSGEYFKKLRELIRNQLLPKEMDFVSIRKDIFEDVLQETMLATYRKKTKKTTLVETVCVNEIIALPDGTIKIYNNGYCILPKELSAPWILPRKPEQSITVQSMSKMSFRLKDWGYKISTGQLVWNRHKDQLKDQFVTGCHPIIWAEAITKEGKFILRAEKKNHAAWFRFQSGDDFLLTKDPCILLQRTTSKEQDKRLIAAVLPQSLLDKKKAVIVENHLNMILPLPKGKVMVALDVLSAFLNSKAVNDAFRTISGSVAVSAYELEALPIPDAARLNILNNLIESKAAPELIEQECLNLYTAP
jgi:adenine-specific DNA-methyltransferase